MPFDFTRCVRARTDGAHWRTYLHQVDLAGAHVVEQQPVERPVVAVSVGRAHGRARTERTAERPVLADAAETAEPQ